MIYKDYQRNHVILPGREEALEKFLQQEYKGQRHKWRHRLNSNSEDALTWSCFDLLSNLTPRKKILALSEIFEDAYQGRINQFFGHGNYENEQVEVYVGKQYSGRSTKESTEVDASIELPGKLVFVEAKLYSSVSVKSPDKPHDQIAKKLRIGLDSPLNDQREFYFIFLDIAPLDKLNEDTRSKEELLQHTEAGFRAKWKSAWLFDYYKNGGANGLPPLTEALDGIDAPPTQSVANNMGWLTWSDLFKTTLRAMISK